MQERRDRSHPDIGPRNEVYGARRLSEAPLAIAQNGCSQLVTLCRWLKQLVADAGADDETFVLAVMPGSPPQLLIDDSARIELVEDMSEFRFLLKTRLGWQVLLHTAQLPLSAELCGRYVGAKLAGCPELDRALFRQGREARN